MPNDLEYADDVDFMSTSLTWLKAQECSIPDIFATWHLTVNVNKTELTELLRGADRIEEEWRMTRKLGSLLGDAEDVSRRKQLATVAFRSLWQLWSRRHHIHEELRIRLYNAYVLPVLFIIQQRHMGPNDRRY